MTWASLGGVNFPPTLPAMGHQSPLSGPPQAVYPELSILLLMIRSSVASPGCFPSSFLDLSVNPSQPTTSDSSPPLGTLLFCHQESTLHSALSEDPTGEPPQAWRSSIFVYTQSLSFWRIWPPQGLGLLASSNPWGRKRPEGRAQLASPSPCGLLGSVNLSLLSFLTCEFPS